MVGQNYHQVIESFDSAIFQLANFEHTPTGISEFTCFLCLAFCVFMLARFHKRYDCKVFSLIGVTMVVCCIYLFLSYFWDLGTERGSIIISRVDESVWAFLETMGFSLGMLFILELHKRVTSETLKSFSDLVLCRKNVETFSYDQYLMVDEAVVRKWEKNFVSSFVRFCWIMIFFNMVMLILTIVRSSGF